MAKGSGGTKNRFSKQSEGGSVNNKKVTAANTQKAEIKAEPKTVKAVTVEVQKPKVQKPAAPAAAPVKKVENHFMDAANSFEGQKLQKNGYVTIDGKGKNPDSVSIEKVDGKYQVTVSHYFKEFGGYDTVFTTEYDTVGEAVYKTKKELGLK